MLCCPLKHSPSPPFSSFSIRVYTSLEQHTHNAQVTPDSCTLERRNAMAICGGGVHIGTSVKEETYNFQMP